MELLWQDPKQAEIHPQWKFYDIAGSAWRQILLQDVAHFALRDMLDHDYLKGCYVVTQALYVYACCMFLQHCT